MGHARSHVLSRRSALSFSHIISLCASVLLFSLLFSLLLTFFSVPAVDLLLTACVMPAIEPCRHHTSTTALLPSVSSPVASFFSLRSSRRAAVFIWYSHQYLLSDSTVPVDLFTCMATPFLCLRHSWQHIAAVLCQNCGQDARASSVGEGRFPTAMQLCWQGAVPFVPWASVDNLPFFGAQWKEQISRPSGPFGFVQASSNWQNTCI